MEKAQKLVVLVVIVFFGAKWLLDGAYFLSDMIGFTGPVEQVFAQAQRAGKIPWWSPDFGNGYPLFSNGQVHFFYWPHVLLRFFLDGPYLLNASLILHMVLAASGMYAWLRWEKIAAVAAAMGALVFVFGGAVGARYGLTNFVTALTWMPWLGVGLQRYMEQGRKRDLGWLVVVSVSLIYSGNPQATVLVLLAAMIYWVGLFWGAEGKMKKMLGLSGAGLAVAGLAMPFVLSTGSLVPFTDRGSGQSFAELFAMSFSKESFLTAIIPYPFGHADSYRGPRGEAELNIFVGLGVLGLAGLGALLIRRWLVSSALILIVTGVFLAMGEYNPVAAWLIVNSPLSAFATPARYMFLTHVGLVLLASVGLDELIRWKVWPDKWWRYAVVGLVLPPMALTWMFEDGVEWRALQTPALVVELKEWPVGRVFVADYLVDEAPAGNFGVAVWRWVEKGKVFRQTLESPYEKIGGVRLRLSAPSFKSDGLVAVKLLKESGELVAQGKIMTKYIVDGEMMEVRWEEVEALSGQLVLQVESDLDRKEAPRLYVHSEGAYDPTGRLLGVEDDIDVSFELMPGMVGEVVWAQELLGPNVAAGYGLASTQWTGSLPVREVALYQERMRKEYAEGNGETWRAMLDRMNARYVVTISSAYRTLNDLADMVGAKEVLKGDKYLRVFENEQAWPRAHLAQEVIAVADEDEQIEMIGQLGKQVVVADVDEDRKLTAQGVIESAVFEDNVLKFIVDSSGEEFLIVRDTYFPDWQSYIDGRKVETFRVDGIFRGVMVPAGRHEVMMRYEPYWLKLWN